MKELKEGLYIAQSTELNVLVNLVGKAPMLEVLIAIDLNAFKQGTVRVLKKDSVEMLHLLRYPENYNFEEPSVSSAINNIRGMKSFGYIREDAPKDVEEKYLQIYINNLKITNNAERAKNLTAIKMKEEENIDLPRGYYICNKFKQALAQQNS